MSLWFATPAWSRPEIVAVCLEQRRRLIEDLRARGVEAHCVVVGDDENLEMARSLGMHIVERDNQWLGRKFNDAYQYAGEHGAEWIVPIGSDDFVDLAYLYPLPDPRHTRTGHWYAPVLPDQLAECHVGMMGGGPRMFHRSIFPRGFRPAPDEINRNTDSSTIRGLVHPPAFEWRDLHPLQYVGFRQPPFTTLWANLWRRWGQVIRQDPWERLATVYPADLVERARKAMAG